MRVDDNQVRPGAEWVLVIDAVWGVPWKRGAEGDQPPHPIPHLLSTPIVAIPVPSQIEEPEASDPTLETDVRQYQELAQRELSLELPSLGSILRMRMALHAMARDAETAPVNDRLAKAFKQAKKGRDSPTMPPLSEEFTVPPQPFKPSSKPAPPPARPSVLVPPSLQPSALAKPLANRPSIIAPASPRLPRQRSGLAAEALPQIPLQRGVVANTAKSPWQPPGPPPGKSLVPLLPAPPGLPKPAPGRSIMALSVNLHSSTNPPFGIENFEFGRTYFGGMRAEPEPAPDRLPPFSLALGRRGQLRT